MLDSYRSTSALRRDPVGRVWAVTLDFAPVIVDWTGMGKLRGPAIRPLARRVRDRAGAQSTLNLLGVVKCRIYWSLLGRD